MGPDEATLDRVVCYPLVPNDPSPVSLCPADPFDTSIVPILYSWPRGSNPTRP